MNLPICEQTEIPRVLCDHCDSFTMTEAERAYLNGWEAYAPATSTERTLRSICEYSGGSWSEPQDVKVVDSEVICRTPGCTRPSGDAFVCAPCIDDLEVCLGDVPSLAEDLMVSTMRQARFSSSGGGGLADRTPLPFNPGAAARLAYLNSTLVAAVHVLTRNRGLRKPVGHGPAALSRWLLKHARTVALVEVGGDIVANVKREHARAMATIDCPPERTYIGLCDKCHAPMHAKQDTATHRCRDCGAEYTVAERMDEQRNKVHDSLLSVPEIAALSGQVLGGRITEKQLEGLVARGRLLPAQHRIGTGRHKLIALYRVSDVIAIMDQRKAG